MTQTLSHRPQARWRTPQLSVAQARHAAAELGRRIAPGSIERDRLRQHPLAEVRSLATTGLLGLTVPTAAGGSGLPRSVAADVLRLVARGDSNVAQIVLAHFVLLDVADLAAKPELLAELHEVATSGGWIGNATAERGTEHVFDRRTVAELVGDGTAVVSGRKFYSTGALGSTLVGVAANLDGDPQHPVVVFVSPDDPGVSIEGDWSGFGQRSTASGTVLLDEVRVAAHRVLDLGPLPQDPPRSPVGAYDQLLHAAIDVGIARAALEEGAQFVRSSARPWVESGVERVGDEPHVQLAFGRLRTRLAALEALFERAGAAVDAADSGDSGGAGGGRRTASEARLVAASLAVAEAKAFAQEVGPEIATEVIELAGTSAVDERHGLDRHWRNVRTHSLHDPARWKYVHLGADLLHGTPPPKHPLF